MPTATAMLKVIPYTRFDSPTTFRLVDEEGHLIAKVNGEANVPLVQSMANAFNHSERMRGLLKNRLMEILKNLHGSGANAFSIRLAAKDAGEQEGLIAMLKSQMEDAPLALTSMIGGEAVQILQVI